PSTTPSPTPLHDALPIYSNAQLIWGLPQAIITVSLMAALLPRISRSAADDDPGAVRDDISQGLRTTAVAIVPVAFGFVALGIPLDRKSTRLNSSHVKISY